MRANPKNVYCPNDDGDNFFNAVLSLRTKSPVEQRRLLNGEKALREWMSQAFGVNLNHIARWMVCLRYEQYRDAFFNIVQTHYGRINWNVTLAERIVNARFDEVSNISELTGFYSNSS